MEKYLIIENANSSGQGHNPFHSETPYHDLITQFGWEYSHTTPVTGLDNVRFAVHTYKRGGWNVSVECRKDYTFVATASKSGRSRETRFHNRRELEAYLKRKSRELK